MPGHSELASEANYGDNLNILPHFTHIFVLLSLWEEKHNLLPGVPVVVRLAAGLAWDVVGETSTPLVLFGLFLVSEGCASGQVG